MLPISLIINGIYSYKTEQKINFESLTAAGLFGIFGTVGAGKSSIIEAITAALYGKNERLDHTGFWYNMLNLKSTKAYVIFEFSYEEQRYKFEIHWKRNSKNFADVSYVRTAYKQDGEEWKNISNDAAKILGLSYDHFKRTTIIPQGKFKEFLEITAVQRTQMIKDIFGLNRFDLKDAINEKYKITESEKLVLDGQLKGFETVQPEVISQLHAQLKEAQITMEQEIAALKIQEDQLAAYKTLEDQWEQLNTLQNQLATLHKNHNNYTQRKKDLQEYLFLIQNFKTLLDRKNSQATQLDNLAHQAKSLTATHNQTKIALADVQEQWQNAKMQHSTIDDKKRKLHELELVLHIMDVQADIRAIQLRIQKGQQTVKAKKEEGLIQTAHLHELEASLNACNNSPLNMLLIQNLDEWYWKYTQLKTTINTTKDKTQKIQVAINAILQIFESAQLLPDAVNEYFSSQLALLDKELKSLFEKEKSLAVATQLEAYAALLKDGEACPLCGATEHPNIIHVHHADDTYKEIKLAMAAIEKKKELINTHWKTTEAQRSQLINLQQQFDTLHNELEQHQNELQEHLNAFKWPDFSPDDTSTYLAAKQEFSILEDKKKELHAAISQANQKLSKIKEDTAVYEMALEKLSTEAHLKDEDMHLKLQSFNTIDGNQYIQQNILDVQAEQTTLSKNIEAIEQHYEATRAALQTKELDFQKISGELEALAKQQALALDAMKNIENDIAKTLEQTAYPTIDTIVEILNKPINIQEEQQHLDQFFEKYHSINEQVQQLQNLLEKQPFDKEKLLSLQEAVDQRNASKDRLVSSIASKSTLVSELEKRYETFQKITAAHAQVSERLAHLSELKRMFHGDKFMEYISGTYLRQLCDVANVRFHRLTKNHLSLNINDKMEFEIKDFLNGGKHRGIKTLSGGQMFQASLCLALALAESVQAKSSQDKHFFFIDEGFGTQDKQSIPTIFETLQSIASENRIVGIISHVEELQDNISRYLYVEKDEENGSFITQV